MICQLCADELVIRPWTAGHFTTEWIIHKLPCGKLTCKPRSCTPNALPTLFMRTSRFRTIFLRSVLLVPFVETGRAPQTRHVSSKDGHGPSGKARFQSCNRGSSRSTASVSTKFSNPEPSFQNIRYYHEEISCLVLHQWNAAALRPGAVTPLTTCW